MSDLPRRRGRCFAASAVAFLLPGRPDVPFVFRPKSCTSSARCCCSWTSSAPPCPDRIAARPQTTARENTRIRRGYFGGGGGVGGGVGALFAEVAALKEEDAEPSPSAAAVQQIGGETDLVDNDLPLGGSAALSAEPRSPMPKRWKRIRSTAVGRALGRVFRGRPGLVEGHNVDDTASVNSVVAQRLPVDRGGGGGLRSPFRVWRRQRQEQSPSGTVDGPLAEAVGRKGRGGGVREGGQERVHESENVVVAAAAAAVAAAAAGCDSGGVAGDSAEADGRAVAPAKYDGEEVLPEAWAKVDELRARAESSDPNAGEEERGVHAWLATGGGEGREGLTDTDLLRFIMFRHGDVDAAWRQLKQAAAWRQERRVDAVLSEDRWSRHEELQAEMFWVGRDVDGRPTMVLRSIAHHPGAIDSDEFERYFVFLLEQGRQLWGLGSERQLNIVVDRIGAGIKNQDPRLLRTMLPVFRDTYPDIVYRCYVAPSSWIFRFVWIIAARLVDERQRKRVLLLVGDWQSRLLEDFDPSVLPPHLGGTMSDYPPKQPPDMA